MTIFSTELKNGVIDVWWLYDDGGNSDEILRRLRKICDVLIDFSSHRFDHAITVHTQFEKHLVG